MLIAAFTSAWQAYPQAVHWKAAWLLRAFGSTCPHAEQRWLVNAGSTFSTRPGAFSSRRRASRPHPDRRMPRFSPALALIKSNRRARSVLAFSAQSLRRSVSRARSRAIACLSRARRSEPRLARAGGAQPIAPRRLGAVDGHELGEGVVAGGLPHHHAHWPATHWRGEGVTSIGHALENKVILRRTASRGFGK